ncbi:MAG: hypothetical protein M1361_01575 [Patescibacteria group bacterium]|nr:hypothetical protein [Patescibacteria group bacterium]MCL5224285.1 hypothetical protein [Patescibacteria group bacterium]
MDDYLETLRKRAKESKVYSYHQLVGLTIAELLQDDKHKALYIKLAKLHNPDKLVRLARDVAERKNVKNKGAYFMRLLYNEKNTNGKK